jgi:phage-related protein
MLEENLKPVRFVGSSRKDLRSFPDQARRDIGRALYTAQCGNTDPAAKPLKGFGGTSVMEIVSRHAGDAYRAAYAAQVGDVIYVLHVFQKKSKRGIETPLKDIALIRARLAEAERLHQERVH